MQSGKQKPHLRFIQLLMVKSLSPNCTGSFQHPSLTCHPLQAEKKKAAQGDDSHGNPEIERLRKEVQDTKQINKKLRELLQVWRLMFAVEVKQLDVCPRGE